MAVSAAFLKLVANPVSFRLFLLRKLPAAFFTGIRIKGVSADACTVTVPYGWFTQNPFRSTYFACLNMAAEMSTGVLAMAHVHRRKPPVSMLITGMQSKFHKKATSTVYFTCTDGAVIQAAVQATLNTQQGQTVEAYARGEDRSGTLIAECRFTWSFKVIK